jgi:K+-sensing histidine kinase KdpD
VRKRGSSLILHYLAALATVLILTGIFRKLIHVNATTVALTFLLAVQVVSTVPRLDVSAFMSVVATLFYN